MENIILASVDQRIKDFMAMPAGPLKNITYKNMHNTSCYDASVVYKDDCIYYGCTTYKLSKGKHSYFLKATIKDGFTLDPKGKLAIWYGKSPKKLPRVDDIIRAIGNDWFETGYTTFLTKGILEKILNKKITNPLGFFEAWLKAQRLKASPRLVYKAVKVASAFTVYSMLLKYQSIFHHLDQFLELMIKHYDESDPKVEGLLTGDFIDMCDQAVLLETMVDPYWSAKRIQIEHERMTHEIMELQMDAVSDTPIEGLDEIKDYVDNEYMTLLVTERDVFREGKTMHHCIYTNYWQRISNKKILCIHVNYKGHTGTLTLEPERGSKSSFQLYDFRDKYNKNTHSDAQHYVKSWLNKFNEWLFIHKLEIEPVMQYEMEGVEPFLPF